MGPTYHAPFERVHLAQGTWELSWWGKEGSCTTETQAGAEGLLKNRSVDSLVCFSSVPFTRPPRVSNLYPTFQSVTISDSVNAIMDASVLSAASGDRFRCLRYSSL